MVRKITAIARIAIHAPDRNFVTSTMINTTAVQQNPTALISWLRRIRRRAPGSDSVWSSRFQCRIIPACEQVNDTNTPTMYSWIRESTSAWNRTIRMTATTARNTMPLENANRSPRVWNCRGRNRSCARIDPNTGKPLKAVLQASTRINPVTNDTT